MPVINKTISQLKIGDTFYNIQDAQVREVLSNVTNNVVTLQSDYFSSWGKNTVINQRSTTLYVHDATIKVWINNNGELNYQKAIINGNDFNWTGKNSTNSLLPEIPEKVKQCGIFLQYDPMIKFEKEGCITEDIYRRNITGSTNWVVTNNTDYSAMAFSRKTFSKSLNGTLSIRDTVTLTDRIVANDSNTNTGAAYKLVLSNYRNGNNDNVHCYFQGLCGKIFFIIQGFSNQSLIPTYTDSEFTNQENPDGDADDDA